MIKKANQPDEPTEREIALQAAKRATHAALHGPAHLRTGRYHPTPGDGLNDTKPNNRAEKPSD